MMKQNGGRAVIFIGIFALMAESVHCQDRDGEVIELAVQADGLADYPDLNTSIAHVNCANYRLTVATSVRSGEFYLTELSVNGNKMGPHDLESASRKIRLSGEFAHFGVRCYRNVSVSVVFFPYVPPGREEPEDIYVAEYSEREGFWRPPE